MAPGEKKATKRQSIHPSAVPADVDGAVALVGASRTVGVVRDDGCAHQVEALELVGGELDGCGAQVVGELVGVAHPQDHRGDRGLRLKPGKRHLPLIDPLGLRYLLDRVEDLPCPFLHVARFPRLHSALRVLAQARGSRRVGVALVLAGEPFLTEQGRTPITSRCGRSSSLDISFLARQTPNHVSYAYQGPGNRTSFGYKTGDPECGVEDGP